MCLPGLMGPPKPADVRANRPEWRVKIELFEK